MNNFSIITYHAAFLVWNYLDRKGSEVVSKSNSEIDQQIISTLSLKSISTTKNKSSSHGTFEVRLAPTKNWINVLTPGSWCAILLSRVPLERTDIDSSNASSKADSKKVKFFGRIDSIRVAVSSNQQSGGRNTEYIVTGTDWGSIFNTTLYVDPALAWDAKNNDTPVGFLSQLIYKQALNSQLLKTPSTVENLRTILKFWGSKTSDIGKPAEDAEEKGLIVKPEIRFTLPKEVAKFFNFVDQSGTSINSNAINDLIQLYHGNLKKINNLNAYEDSYDSTEESFGLIHGEDVLNSHEVWSVLNSLGNNVINEILCDLRWENEKPVLALYKRIKPFIVDRDRLKRDGHEVGDKKTVSSQSLDTYVSEFKNIRRVEIPLHEVLSFNAGTNWRDKINFIEVKPTDPLLLAGIAPQIRFDAQFYDRESFSREGLKPFIAGIRTYPKATIENLRKSIDETVKNNDNASNEEKDQKKSKGESKKPNNEKATHGKNIEAITEWKYLFKEWYFDTHRMLNGSVSFMGQDRYIQVGDNIMIDAKITGYAENTTYDQMNNRGKAYLLAHVESISHSFSIDGNDARHFTTNVSFVRGIIVDRNGSKLAGSEDSGQIEQDTRKTKLIEEINHANISVKTKMDPD